MGDARGHFTERLHPLGMHYLLLQVSVVDSKSPQACDTESNGDVARWELPHGMERAQHHCSQKIAPVRKHRTH